MKTPNPLNRFFKEHKQVLEYTQTLQHCVDEFQTKGYSKQRAALFVEAMDALNHHVHIHNALEEKALLKMLDEVLLPPGPTFIMRQEHKELRRVARRLQNAFQGLQGDTKNRSKLVKLRLTSEWLIRLLRRHISNQDAVLFPLAQCVLTPQQMGEVARRLCNNSMATA